MATIDKQKFEGDVRRDLVAYLSDVSGKCRYKVKRKGKTSDVVVFIPKVVISADKVNAHDNFIQKYLKTSVNNFKKEINDSTDSYYTINIVKLDGGKDAKTETTIIVNVVGKTGYTFSTPQIQIRVRCVAEGGNSRKYFKATDFLSSGTARETIDYKQFTKKQTNKQSYYFTSARALKAVVTQSVKTNNKFDAVEAEVVGALLKSIGSFNITKTNTERLSNGFSYEIPEIKSVVSLMAAFSEVLIPYMFLCHKIPTVSGVYDYSANNVTGVAFPTFDVEKIDFVVFYKSNRGKKLIKRMNFSMKWGAGHEVSVGNLLKTEGLNFEEDSFLGELRNLFALYNKKRLSDIGVSDIFFIKESGCFDTKKGASYTNTEGVYSELFKNATKYKSKIADYRAYLKENQTKTYEKLENFKTALMKEADRLGVNYVKDTFENSFPFSISRLVALMIAKASDTDKVKNQLKDLILEGGYHQIRIDNNKAQRGKIHFTIVPIFKSTDAQVDLEFVVSGGWGDFKLKSGAHFAGYRVK